MLYRLEIDHIVENKVISKWMEADFDKVVQMEKNLSKICKTKSNKNINL